RRWVLALPYSSEFDVTISDTATPAPSFLHNWRNGRSVTPAIGATKRLLRKVKPANCMGVGIPGGGWKGDILPQPGPAGSAGGRMAGETARSVWFPGQARVRGRGRKRRSGPGPGTVHHASGDEAAQRRAQVQCRQTEA